MKDGGVEKLVVPWSSNCEAVNAQGFGPVMEIEITCSEEGRPFEG